MSSSTFEVTEAENETEKELNFGLQACEENGIGVSLDGEVPKDHNYTKDPDESEEDKADESQVDENEKDDSSEKSPSKKGDLKTPRMVKKVNTKMAKVKKELPKKERYVPKRGKTKKEVLTEESNKTEDISMPEEKANSEELSKTPKRGKKRKVEEKENVIDRSIVEEVQNINETDSTTEAITESPAKKRGTGSEKIKKKQTKAESAPTVNKDDNPNLPTGWVRKEVVRKSGKSAGQVDVYIYSPDGIKFRSRPDIAAYLAKTKSNLKPENFNFSRKKIFDDTLIKSTPKKEKQTSGIKRKSTPEKKAKLSSPGKRGSKLVVKLNFSPKNKKGKNTKKASFKPTKQSPVKRGKASSANAKENKKKKSA